MIKQCAVSDIESRSECNPYNSEGFLPIITSPMYSVVNEDNINVFLENKVQVCLPRNTGTIPENGEYFVSYSLNDFIKNYITQYEIAKISLTFVVKVCIDTAAGHLKSLHEAIRKAKEIHGSNLIIMAGNVASVDAFIELAETGCDYIRVGIGGGGGCNTTSNTGVGQKNLAKLISKCKYQLFIIEDTYNPKIVADGISSYINYCQKKYGYNDNGYAAINTLLDSGSDVVMIGKLFVQCLESAGEKAIGSIAQPGNLHISDIASIRRQYEMYNDFERCYVKYSGMSTLQEQEKYKDVKKPSEGSVQWIPIRWLLSDWLTGNDAQDSYPYLMGWVNSIKTVGSYTGNKTI